MPAAPALNLTEEQVHAIKEAESLLPITAEDLAAIARTLRLRENVYDARSTLWQQTVCLPSREGKHNRLAFDIYSWEKTRSGIHHSPCHFIKCTTISYTVRLVFLSIGCLIVSSTSESKKYSPSQILFEQHEEEVYVGNKLKIDYNYGYGSEDAGLKPYAYEYLIYSEYEELG
eukprot:scaffold3759_cov124-Skeletonema_dohrnii-CCMP3373.AAC.3